MTRPFSPAPKPEPREPKPARRIPRYVAVKKRNAARKGHRCPKLVLEDFRAWIRLQPCCVTGLSTGDTMPIPHGSIRVTVQAMHVKAKGPGNPDAANLLPMNQYHHHLHDQVMGPGPFRRFFGVKLFALARRYYRQYREVVGHG